MLLYGIKFSWYFFSSYKVTSFYIQSLSWLAINKNSSQSDVI